MVNRVQAKTAAKNTMRTALVNPMMIGAIYLIITAILNFIDLYVSGDLQNYMRYVNSGFDPAALVTNVATPQSIFVSILVLLISCVLSAGISIYCLGINRGQEMPWTSIFDGFAMVGKIILLYILEFIFITLWTCLFIIPGFIAAYRYSFAIFNLIEYDVSPMEAIRMSKYQTKGFKMDLFVLDLSFLGWTILSMFTMGILSIWLIPYMQLTLINYYMTIRNINVIAPSNGGGAQNSGNDPTQNL